MTDDELEIVRSAFAKQVLAVAGVAEDVPLENAFRIVKRENFLGSEPWLIGGAANGRALPSNDPVYVYQDVIIQLMPERGVNNGSPSLHARMLHMLSVQPGQTVVHLGAGSGYYSAILSQLVGPTGQVIAIEFDTQLSSQAEQALAGFPNIQVINGDAADWPKKEVDGIYINFAVTEPHARWIDRLALNGKLVLPLGVPVGTVQATAPQFLRGGTFVIKRGQTGFEASFVGPTAFISAEGKPRESPNPDCASLKRAFESPGAEFVRSLIWRRPADPTRCWFFSPRWSLSYDSNQ